MSDLKTHQVCDQGRLTEAASFGPFSGLQGIRHSHRFCRCTVRLHFGRGRVPTGRILRPQSLVCWRPSAMNLSCFRHFGYQAKLVSNVCCVLLLILFSLNDGSSRSTPREEWP